MFTACTYLINQLYMAAFVCLSVCQSRSSLRHAQVWCRRTHTHTHSHAGYFCIARHRSASLVRCSVWSSLHRLAVFCRDRTRDDTNCPRFPEPAGGGDAARVRPGVREGGDRLSVQRPCLLHRISVALHALAFCIALHMQHCVCVCVESALFSNTIRQTMNLSRQQSAAV